MKKIKSSISRNLILSFVLLVTILFAVFAWFSHLEIANASGLAATSVTAKGLEVAFEDVDEKYSDTLVDDSKKYYPLVSSNGSSFLIPMLNRTTGQAIVPYTSKRDAVANQDYYETDLFFRSDRVLDVNLMAGSKVKPHDYADGKIDNKSDFGNFTKDYIAGAARVAFFNVDSKGKETLNSIWIPNSSYQLIESSNFTKVKPTSEGSSDGWNIPGTLDYANPLYLHEKYAKGTSISIERQNKKMHYDSVTNKYYGVLDISGDFEVDHMVAVSTSNAEYPLSSTILTNNKTYFDNNQYKFYEPNYYVTVGLAGDFYADDTRWPKLYFGISENKLNLFNNVCGFDRFQVFMSYDKVNDKLEIIDFIYYEEANPSNRGGGTGGFLSGETTYKLENNKIVLLTNSYNNALYGISFTNNNLKSSIIADPLDTIVTYNSNAMFLVREVSEGKYSFKHLPTSKYLTINENNEIDLSATEAVFDLGAGENGPSLSYNGYYLAFQGGYFYTSTDSKSSVIIYEGNTYSFLENGIAETSYTYLINGNSNPTTLNNYYTNVLDVPSIATLAKIDNSGYYKAHIKVRIWAEGTDREAKTPLAGGIFDNILMFEGHRKDE